MKSKGFFITFEGGEGVGKSTQVPLVAERLRQMGYDVVTTREPGGTPLGEEIRNILLSGDAGKMSPATEALLFTAARNQHVERVIKPGVAEGKIVISDRYAGTTAAYQGYKELGMEWTDGLYASVFGDFHPDLCIIFEPPKDKITGDVIAPNRMEAKGDEWLKKGVEGFREYARRHDFCVLKEFAPTIQENTAAIMQIIKDKLCRA